MEVIRGVPTRVNLVVDVGGSRCEGVGRLGCYVGSWFSHGFTKRCEGLWPTTLGGLTGRWLTRPGD